MSNVDHIKHQFIELVAAPYRDLMKRVHDLDPEGKLKAEKFRRVLRKDEEYVFEVFMAAARIVETVEQLHFVPIFLRNFPLRKQFNKYGINRPKYLQYHLETHFIKITTLLDQMAILINKVFRLGFAEKNCSVDAILENEHTKHSTAAKELKTFNKSIQGIKSVRNLIVHRGIFNDGELNEIGMFYCLSENRAPDEEELFPECVLKFKTKFIIKHKIGTVTKNNKVVDIFVSNGFNALIDEFKKHHCLLSVNES